MVLQKEIIELITEKFIKGTVFTVECGDTVTVDYEDNALDNVYSTITSVNTSIVNDTIKHISILEAGEGNGNDHNAILLKGDNKSIDKAKFTEFTKDADTIVTYNDSEVFVME